MDLTHPAHAVVPSADAEVLVVLAGTSRPLTGLEVHRLSGVSARRTQQILDRMVEHGLVIGVEAGLARLHTLNREHVAAEAVITLSDLRGCLFSRMRNLISTWQLPPVAAAVFGSAARGDGGPSSDIDIVVVRLEDVD